jgi:type IV pilus assembly protein PilC
MARFLYKAKDGPERTVEREIHAATRADAIARIEAEGLIPISVQDWRPAAAGLRRRCFAPRRIRRREVTLFTLQLASLLRSGVPILRALQTVGEQTETRAMGDVVRSIEAAIRDGAMLSEALERRPRLFPSLYTGMVRAGERAGMLAEMLTKLADARENEEETQRKVQSAMAYPLLVATVGVATVLVLLTFFMPRVMRLFERYEDLPGVTRALMAASRACVDYWYWALLIAILGGAILHRLASLAPGRRFVDTLLLRMPLVGGFVRDVDLARFAHTFALLVESGLPIDQVLLLSGATMRNTLLRDDVARMRQLTTEQGLSLTDGMRQSVNFPVFFRNMLGVGEEGGRIDDMLREVAGYYERAIERRSRLLTSLVEPLLLLVVGGIVGFIVFAMLLPVFELGSGLR